MIVWLQEVDTNRLRRLSINISSFRKIWVESDEEMLYDIVIKDERWVMTISQMQSLKRVDKVLVRAMIEREKGRIKRKREDEAKKWANFTQDNIEKARDEDMAYAMR